MSHMKVPKQFVQQILSMSPEETNDFIDELTEDIPKDDLIVPPDINCLNLHRSDLMAANFRGLEAPDEPEEGKFVYTNCLDRPYNDDEQKVKSVSFKISRYGKFTKTIKFSPKATEKEAIMAVEIFLSKPLTKQYYEKIKNDTFHEHEWKEAKKYFNCRGDCLTDAKFLEVVYFDEETKEMTFFIGS